MKGKVNKWGSFADVVNGAEVSLNKGTKVEEVKLSKYSTRPKVVDEKAISLSKNLQDEFFKAFKK